MNLQDSILVGGHAIFENNFATQGGAIYAMTSNVQIDNIIFRFNRANEGSGVHFGSSSVIMKNIKMENNFADIDGGAINIKDGLGILDFTHSICQNNIGGCAILSNYSRI